MSSKKILIAEDERPLSQALQYKLEKKGYAVETVADGEAAMKLLDSTAFDITLMDILMPGLDGTGVLEHIQSNYPHLKTIVISNLNDQERIETCRELGASEYLVKSETSIDEIVQLIQQYEKADD